MRTVEVIKSEILEYHIKAAGLCAELSVLQGNTFAANEWQQQMKVLIGQRTPEQIDRMETAIDKAIGGI